MNIKKLALEDQLQVSPIRLAADETRLIVKAATRGVPVEGHACSGLADLGIFIEVPTDDKQHKADLSLAWKELVSAAKAQDLESVQDAARRLGQLERQHTSCERKFYQLTPFGKQVARGVTVRMGRP